MTPGELFMAIHYTEFTTCPDPDCQDIAEVELRDVMESTDGPIEYVRTRCVRGHWFAGEARSLFA